MTYQLFPHLPLRVAKELAAQHSKTSEEDLRRFASVTHEKAETTATGGHRVSPSQLASLGMKVRALRDDCAVASDFDARLGRLLHQEMRISRAEASQNTLWAFLGCVLLPDVVRWRFSGDETPTDRFIGGNRGVRSPFGRAWWRGELLRDEVAPNGDPYWLLSELTEDELTGIVERQRAVASRRVALALARALRVETARAGDSQRLLVAREGFKLYLRDSAFVAFEALTDSELVTVCESIFRRAVRNQRAHAAPK